MKVPEPFWDEMFQLNRLEDDIRSPTSRLGRAIVMTKELDGLTVYIPEQEPLETMETRGKNTRFIPY